MILTAILTGVFVFLANLAIVFFMARVYQSQKAKLLETLRAYFETPDGQTPSQFASLVECVADTFGHKIMTHAKATFMGTQSVDSKNIARLEGDVVQDMIAQKSPLLSVILSQFPSVARRVAKNPNLLPLIQSMLPGLGTGAPKEDHGSDFEQRLHSYGGY